MSGRKSPAKILFITTAHPAWGNGHFLRVQSWQREFPNMEVIDLVLESKYEPVPEMLLKGNVPVLDIPQETSPATVFRRWKDFLTWWDKREYHLVVIDRREPPLVLVETIHNQNIPLVAFDIRSCLSGRGRRYREAWGNISYVMNLIPSLERDWANLNGWEYLFFPLEEKKQNKVDSGQKGAVLYLSHFYQLSYLTNAVEGVCDYLNSSLFHGCSPKSTRLSIISSEESIPQVKNILATHSRDIDYRFLPFDPTGIDWERIDLLFTHFGLLGFEAISRGVPVYFLEPTPYHRELTVRYFPELLLSQAGRDVSVKQRVAEVRKRIGKIGKGRKRISGIMRSLADRKLGPSICDLCGGPLRVKHRRSWMNLSLCSSCGSYCQKTFVSENSSQERCFWEAPQEDYDSEYFITEYEKSYGRSYIADEATIKTFARSRMEVINRLMKGKERRILDIGCAYGFFLDVAREYGYNTYGVDISRHAEKQVRTHRFALGDFCDPSVLNSFNSSYDHKRAPLVFDVITLWYVIEHFSEIDSVVAKISSLQRSGGILGFSTPNAQGLTSRFNNREFLNSSPADHCYIFSLSGLKKLFFRHGYTFVEFRASGIHYSRFEEFFPRLSSWIPESIYRKGAALANLGDTMEVYFRKQ